MLIREQFFPTTIYGKDVKLDNRLFEQEIVAWSKNDPGVKKTNMNGWHSQTNMEKIPVFEPLVKELFTMMEEVWKAEHLDRVPLLGNMWANINYPNGYNKSHVHPNCLFSGVYYIKAPKNSGDLICNDPRPGMQNTLPARLKGQLPKHMWRECTIEPVEGRILVFPAWLWHQVEPNQSNNIRISASFNFIQHGFQ
jgi:uncharacterized protein (TIGR02466 family)